MKKEVAKAIMTEIVPVTSMLRGVLKITRKIRRKAGRAYANWEKVNPKMIFSLCCNGGGMS
jgi:hypothetical protein